MARMCLLCQKSVQNLSSHLSRVHKINGPERTYWFQQGKIFKDDLGHLFKPTTLQTENGQADNCSKFQLLHPFTCMVAGTTGCGKTVWVQQLLDHAHTMITPPPQRIVYCYSQWQPAYVEMLRTVPGIEFIRGIPQELEKDHFFDIKLRNLIVIDDQMTETGNDKRIVNLFAKGSHHRNLSVIYMVQNIFHQGKVNRDISLNCHYLVIFKNPRDKLQILNLARQMYPGKTEYFLEKYEQAVSRPFGYLFIDLKTTTQDNCRLRTNVFPGEEKEQEKNVPEELLQYIERQNLVLPPEISRMQNLKDQMNNLLKDSNMDKSQKARQYIQLQNNYLSYKKKMNPSLVGLASPTSIPSPAEEFQSLLADQLSIEPARSSPLPAEPSNFLPPPASSPITASPVLVSTEPQMPQTPTSSLMAPSPLIQPPSSLLTPPDSLPKRRKRPRLELKNYLEGNPTKNYGKSVRRSVRVKMNRSPYKYER